MTRLALIRHAATVWNETGRIQGHSDVPLSTAGRQAAADWRVPPELAAARWLVSPLARARQTAALLGLHEFSVEPRLIEMDWGEWEGQRLAALRQELGPAMVANEARGLDFEPPGGESPRRLQARLAPLLAEIAEARQATAAISHKGVIRAIFAQAMGWDMTGPPPVKLHWDRAHLFDLADDGTPHVERLNLPLVAS